MSQMYPSVIPEMTRNNPALHHFLSPTGTSRPSVGSVPNSRLLLRGRCPLRFWRLISAIYHQAPVYLSIEVNVSPVIAFATFIFSLHKLSFWLKFYSVETDLRMLQGHYINDLFQMQKWQRYGQGYVLVGVEHSDWVNRANILGSKRLEKLI